MTALIPEVEISPEWDKEYYEAERTWSLLFSFRWPDGHAFQFNVSEPYMSSHEEWLSLANKHTKFLGLYQGNGEGSIEHAGDQFRFTAAPSGAGGDVRAAFVCPTERVVTPLLAAIGKATQAGMPFK